jgi:hypothetical protein
VAFGSGRFRKLRGFAGEEKFEVLEVGGRCEFRIGRRVFQERDRMSKLLDGLRVVGDVKLFRRYSSIGA